MISSLILCPDPLSWISSFVGFPWKNSSIGFIWNPFPITFTTYIVCFLLNISLQHILSPLNLHTTPCWLDAPERIPMMIQPALVNSSGLFFIRGSPFLSHPQAVTSLVLPHLYMILFLFNVKCYDHWRQRYVKWYLRIANQKIIIKYKCYSFIDWFLYLLNLSNCPSALLAPLVNSSTTRIILN